MIVIPMAGMSSRFFKAGYSKPKYMLEAHGETLFSHAVKSFKAYFKCKPFLFIIKDAFDTPSFVLEQIKKLGIEEYYIEVLQQETRGQAETVYIGLKQLFSKGLDYSGEITVFNIDTFRPNFQFPKLINESRGYLEVFKGEGENWSFARAESPNSNVVIETAEKKAISDLCSTGLYHFEKVTYFLESFDEYIKLPKESWDKGELYIAPLYNLMIKKGLVIRYHLINDEDVIFCGVPSEYDDFLSLDMHK
ncbi:glycosyltransferase family 2 protein [Vibrio vulnificus]